jgi:hypothetical protein
VVLGDRSSGQRRPALNVAALCLLDWLCLLGADAPRFPPDDGVAGRRRRDDGADAFAGCAAPVDAAGA